MTADAAAELERLKEEISACTRCDLHCTANKAVPGEGPADAAVMLIGEGPGFNEDKQGRPFVGAAGKFLEQLLELAGLTRPEVFITNVVKHRPPNNRDPAPDELAACRPWLDQQIALIRPVLIVTLGRHSLGTFFPGSLISKVHGELREKDGRLYFHMYHPAAALHQERLKQTLLDDMQKLGKFLGTPAFKDRVAARVGGTEASPGENASGDDEPPAQLSLF